MIFGNIATYPPRVANLPRVLATIAPQVDRLTIVMNQFEDVPSGLKIPKNTEIILPDKDYKDVGKFLPDTSGSDYVFLFDDDIVYPDDYTSRSLKLISKIAPEDSAWGYHASWYEKPNFDWSFPSLKARWRLFRHVGHINSFRKVHFFGHALQQPTIVDQLGTGTAIIRTESMPSMEYMDGSQCFVDVRFARWCFESRIRQIALPRIEGWLRELDHDEAIYKSFTSSTPKHVSREIRKFAFRRELSIQTVHPKIKTGYQ